MTATADPLIHWLRDFAQRRINSRLMDERRCIPPYVVLDLGNQGILGMQVSPQYGGLGMNHRETLRVIEQLAGIDLTLATLVVINSFLGVRLIQGHATPELKEELLPLLAKGRELVSFALTESGAGSNPRAIAGTGRPNPEGGWLLNGKKIWIGSGSWAGVVSVFVNLYDGEGKPQGMTGFVLRQDSPGLSYGPEAMTLGMRGVVQTEVILEDAPVQERQLLGAVGQGMSAAQEVMLFTRLAIATKSLGGMKRCAQLMARYSRRRTVGTGNLWENPLTRFRLGRLNAAITALETLVYRLADLLDAGVNIPTEAYIACKTSGPEFLGQAADDLIQLLGGRGYIETNLAPQIFRDARIFRIFEGPTETLNMFFGSSLIRPRKELQRFFVEILAAPQVWERLTAHTQSIYERWSKQTQPFGEKNAALGWAFSQIGELGMYAVLLAALEEKLNHQPTTALKRSRDWAEAEFKAVARRALDGATAEILVGEPEESADLIAGYEDAIGDLEQTLPGEDWRLDDYLRR
ncbi:MAG: acyl-CoA dehydrogenase [Cyanobacteria bacterium RI_101]|nr:acyl-CoA dehydrogenase [Cyanobacteria bacterium RI_101]